MSRTIHVGIYVRGAIKDREMLRAIALSNPDEDGTIPSVEEVRARLVAMVAQGIEMIPIGEPCDGWCPVNGCPGHDDEDVLVRNLEIAERIG